MGCVVAPAAVASHATRWWVWWVEGNWRDDDAAWFAIAPPPARPAAPPDRPLARPDRRRATFATFSPVDLRPFLVLSFPVPCVRVMRPATLRPGGAGEAVQATSDRPRGRNYATASGGREPRTRRSASRAPSSGWSAAATTARSCHRLLIRPSGRHRTRSINRGTSGFRPLEPRTARHATHDGAGPGAGFFTPRAYTTQPARRRGGFEAYGKRGAQRG